MIMIRSKEYIQKAVAKTLTLSIISLLIINYGNYCHAQSWTLDKCIDTALQNNLSLQSSRIQSQVADVNLKSSKLNLLPSLNAGASHGYNWGQTIDLFTNQFATDRVLFENFYLSSSVSLFSGLRNYYTIKANQTAVSTNELDIEITQRNIKIDVSAAFLQVLINKKMVELYKENQALTQKQLERITILIQENQATIAQQLEIDAQLQTDKYNLIKAKNDLRYSELLLQQLMNIPPKDSITLILLTDDINSQNIQEFEIDKLPEIAKQELEIQQQTYELKAIKGSYYPSLDLSGSLGSGYSGNDKFIDANNNVFITPFREQIQNNLYQSLILTLSIPIFNRYGIKSQVKLKELSLADLNIKNQQEKQQIIQKIAQIRLEINSLSSQLDALSKVEVSTQKNLDNFRLRYENREVDYTQFLEAQNKNFKAKSDLIQAQFELQFKRKILSFYFSE